MKKMLLCAGIIICLISCSSEKIQFGQLQDRNGLFYLVNKTTPYTGDVVSYANGKVEFEGKIENGLRTGLWVYYYPTGQKKSEGKFLDGLKDGTWTTWKDNGQQDVVEAYKVGKRLNSDGTVAAEPVKIDSAAIKAVKKPEPILYERLHGGPTKYLGNVPYTGPVVQYNRDGWKEFDGYFRQGKKDGKWTYYDRFGRIKDVKYF
jgi:antitoxin component YwqK of YwqJK toxin-antitoxin module